MNKYKLTLSKSGDFSKSAPHEMEWSDEKVGFVNPHNRGQIVQVLHNGQPDPLAWIVDNRTKAGCKMEFRFIGAPNPGFKGFAKIELVA